MTDSDREKRIEIVADEIRRADQVQSWPKGLYLRELAKRIVDALPVVSLERAQDLERERDEAAAAAREFVYLIQTLTSRRLESDDPLRLAAADVLARHPSFLPPTAPRPAIIPPR